MLRLARPRKSCPVPNGEVRWRLKKRLFELAGTTFRRSKEKKMKRKISLWLGLLAFAAVPVLAQAPAAGTTGKIHGHVINPTGAPQTSGTVNLSTDNGRTTKYTFEEAANGAYAGK